MENVEDSINMTVKISRRAYDLYKAKKKDIEFQEKLKNN